MKTMLVRTPAVLPLAVIGYVLFQYLLIGLMEANPAVILLSDAVPPLISWYFLRSIAKRRAGSLSRFWSVLSLGALSYFAALLVSVFYAVKGGSLPIPSFADLFWIMQSVLFVFSLCYLLSKRRGIHAGLRFLFDTLVLFTVFSTFSWIYVISPNLNALLQTRTLWGSVLPWIYPLCDFVILCSLLVLYISCRSLMPRKVWAILFGGFFIWGFADTVYIYLIASHQPFIGSWIDPLYSLVLLMLMLAGGYYDRDCKEHTSDEAVYPTSRFRLIVPAVSLIILLLIDLDKMEEWNAFYIGGGLSVMFIVIQLVAALLENGALLRKMADMLKQMEFLANHDVLSGMPNRRCFDEHVTKEMMKLASCGGANGQTLAVMLLDLDRFKSVNDSYGHHTGDQLIRQLAARLKETIAGRGIVARQGGDEFAVLMPDVSGPHEMADWAKRISAAVSRPYSLEHSEFRTTASIGIAFSGKGVMTGVELMRNADLALHNAKVHGGNKTCFYNEELNQSISQKLKMEQALRKAIEQEELILHYQPQFDAGTVKLAGVEALLRWQPHGGKLVSPAQFIPLAEETGLIVPIGEWVLRTACRQASAWLAGGADPIIISVNVSPQQFHEADFVEKVKAILEQSGLAPEYLVLEITESIAIKEESATVAKLTELKKMGVQVAMDDFGTGYSSLGFLKTFQVDKLKIAQEFVRDISGSREQSTILEAILAMAKSLKLDVIAEGVETEEQYRFLKARGCGWIQGYYFSKPLSAPDFERLYLDRSSFRNERSG